MADKYSFHEVFRRYLDSERISGAMRPICSLIASGAFSHASFDKLIANEGLSGAPNLKETLLDLILVFARECVEDHELSRAELDELEILTTVFRIEEGNFYELRRDAVQEVLGHQTRWMLQDRYVTNQEEVLQRDLQRLFGLSYDQYVALLRPLVRTHIDGLENRKLAIQDREELKLIESCIQNLRGVFLVPQ